MKLFVTSTSQCNLIGDPEGSEMHFDSIADLEQWINEQAWPVIFTKLKGNTTGAPFQFRAEIYDGWRE